MPLQQSIFIAFLFIVWITECRKTMQRMERNTKLIDWWINHSICSLLKVSPATLVNLISLTTSTSLFIHLLPFDFKFSGYWILSSKYILFCMFICFIFYRLSFGFITLEFFLFTLLSYVFYLPRKWDFSLYGYMFEKLEV